jgi:hypothetical protein
LPLCSTPFSADQAGETAVKMSCLRSWPAETYPIAWMQSPTRCAIVPSILPALHILQSPPQLAHPTYERRCHTKGLLVSNAAIGAAHNSAGLLGVTNNRNKALRLLCRCTCIFVVSCRFSSLVFRCTLTLCLFISLAVHYHASSGGTLRIRRTLQTAPHILLSICSSVISLTRNSVA